MRTGTIDNGILALIRHTRGMKFSLFLRCLFCFHLAARYWYGGRGRRLCHYHRTANGPAGYDSITTVLVTYIATQIGFAVRG